MKALQVINNFKLSKAEVSKFVSEATVGVLDGGMEDPLLVLARLKAMEEAIKGIKKNLSGIFLENIPEKGSTTHHGVRFEQSSRKNYKFDHCPAWNNIKKQLDDIETRMKNAKGIEVITLVDPDTGEEIKQIEIMKAHFTESTSPKVTLPKE